MFKPKYIYTEKLVSNIGTIRQIIGKLNARRFPQTVLYKLETDAKALSAYSSTSIEGNPLPLTDVRQILKTNPKQVRDTQKEVLNYNKAMLYLDTLIKGARGINLNNKLVLKTHEMVLKGLANFSKGYRVEPVFVNDPRIKSTVYWAPDHQDVQPLINDLVDFVKINNGKIEAIILAGIFHQQFIIIHPFIDGNGRSTRLLTKALLAKMGLDTFQLFSFENYYNNNVTNYFNKVGMRGNYYEVVQGWDFTPWLEYFTNGIIDELNRVEKLLPQSTSLQERLEDHHYIILDLLQGSGVLQDADYAKATKRSQAARTLDFNKLIKLNLIERKGKGRGTYYVLRS